MDANAPERMHLWGRSPLLPTSSRHNGAGSALRHYVVRYRRRGPAPAADVARIAGAVRVLDHAGRMLLVEGRAAQMAGLAAALPRWLVTEEHAFAIGRGSIEAPDHVVADDLRHHPVRASRRRRSPLETGGHGTSGAP